MYNKTKDYSIFTFRKDNRKAISPSHVKRLVESIQVKNLLPSKPIEVTKDMEIINGQHRLLAAKQLGLDVYYTINENFTPEEIVLISITKNWMIEDFLNYFVVNGAPEYIKFRDFCTSVGVNSRVALNLLIGDTKIGLHDFRLGKFKFNGDLLIDDIDFIKDTILYIRRMNGASLYTKSSKFWKAMVKLLKAANFDREKWTNNMHKLVDRFGPRTSCADYTKMLVEIYNWSNKNKIILGEEI
jgi:hypothetical protein